MAKSAICPGLITIIWSLITSNSTGLPDVEDCSDELIEYVNNNNKNSMNYQAGQTIANSPARIKQGIEQEARKVRDMDKIAKW